MLPSALQRITKHTILTMTRLFDLLYNQAANYPIEKSLNTAGLLNCRAVPLFVKFQGKKEISRKPGWSNMQTFEAWVKETH